MNLTMDTIPSNDSGSALNAKIVTMVCVFGISMVVSCLPLLISLKWDWLKSKDGDMRSSNKLVQGLLAFGGGVLFATTFMHLLPELDENIKHLQESGDLPEFKIYVAGLIMCCGFFMMYIIEELVHMYIESRENKVNGNITRALSSKRPSENLSNVDLPMTTKKDKEFSHLPIAEDDDSVATALRGLLIVLALSIHELFEGLAVGLESSTANVWYMFAAVSAHKYIIGFCIGVELLNANTKRWLSVLYIFTFSFVSALGIGIGILLVGGAGAADAGLTSVILQGIACGTLVYVVFFEVWRQDRSGPLQVSCGLVGFIIMVLLDYTVESVAG